MRVGDRVEQNELGDAPLQPLILLQGKQKRDPAAKGMTDQGEIAKVLLLDQLGQQLRLIARRIAFVEGLVGLAEPLEVDGDHPVLLDQFGRDMPPGEGARAEAVQEEDGSPFALVGIIELDRSVGGPEPREGIVDLAGGLDRAACESARDHARGKPRY